MGKWREAFEEGRPSFYDRDYGRVYHFGPPATPEQISEAEQILGRPLPTELLSLLSEFNGVRDTTRWSGADDEGDSVFLSTMDLPDVLGYLRDVEDELPKPVRMGKVVFFWQDNGYAELYGICAERVGRWPAGTIVHLDHESQELKAPYPDLMAFVRGHDKEQEG
ncbi:SMI1/KNR4 family protein [Singulisphaera sp. Ch08]|uniref:SMI1/KNR4 family protein n=1 Tax=Singulisphaera sp. Ch08 TaxID=3120278 RepID=A0AAU7C8Q3_9BACT